MEKSYLKTIGGIECQVSFYTVSDTKIKIISKNRSKVIVKNKTENFEPGEKVTTTCRLGFDRYDLLRSLYDNAMFLSDALGQALDMTSMKSVSQSDAGFKQMYITCSCTNTHGDAYDAEFGKKLALLKATSDLFTLQSSTVKIATRLINISLNEIADKRLNAYGKKEELRKARFEKTGEKDERNIAKKPA
jgi:hypothetical protein